jgi:hypothetical protein
MASTGLNRTRIEQKLHRQIKVGILIRIKDKARQQPTLVRTASKDEHLKQGSKPTQSSIAGTTSNWHNLASMVPIGTIVPRYNHS